jgi:prepilin-type N-terminal cleavage/methylation domain-containing protein
MTIDRRQRPRRARAGFTLAEAMLAMVILSVATAGVLLPAVSGASVQAEGLHRTLGAVLAHGLIEQVVSMPFDEIVADLDAYNYTEQLKDASEDIFRDPMYANYSRELTCTWDPDQDFFILVKVRVFYSGQELVSVNRLISK